MDIQPLGTLENVGKQYSVLESIRSFLYPFLIMLCLGMYIKLTLKRRNFLNAYPTKEISLFNPWGHVKDFLQNAKLKGLHSNAYIIQLMLAYQQLFKNEDFVAFSLGYFNFFAVYKAKVVEELISGSRNLEKNWMYGWLHYWLGTGLLTSNGSKWKSRRKLLSANFHTDILKEFMPIFNEQSKVLMGLLKEESKKPWTETIRLMTLCSIDIVAESTLGIKVGAQSSNQSAYAQAVIRAAETVVKRGYYLPYHIDWYFFLSKQGAQFKKDVKLLHEYTHSVISRRKQEYLDKMSEPEVQEVDSDKKKKKRRPLLDLLLEEHIRNNTLTEEHIREELDTFTFEGHDTTTVGLSWCLYLIGLYPEVQNKVREEIDSLFGNEDRDVTSDDLKELDYMDRVMKESQRLYPSVPFIARSLEKDTEICGKMVPKGTGFFVFQYLLHRDESVFPNPEVFDPDRFLPENVAKRSPFAFIPFSTGSRNCIGQRFALLKEKVVLIYILRNYILESLDPRDKVPPVPELILRPAVPLRIKYRPRIRS